MQYSQTPQGTDVINSYSFHNPAFLIEKISETMPRISLNFEIETPSDSLFLANGIATIGDVVYHSRFEFEIMHDDDVKPQRDTVQEDTVQEDTIQEDTIQEESFQTDSFPIRHVENIEAHIYRDGELFHVFSTHMIAQSDEQEREDRDVSSPDDAVTEARRDEDSVDIQPAIVVQTDDVSGVGV